MEPWHMQQRTLDLRVFRILRIDPRNDHEVIPTAKQVLMEPITLPDQSADTMSDHTVPYFFANWNPKSVLIWSIFWYIHHQISVGITFSVIINILKIPVALQWFRKSHLNPRSLYASARDRAEEWPARVHRKKGHIMWPVNYADNLFLPLARLAAKTFLPPGVLILALKPCTLLLCLFFGWYVIFIFQTPPSQFTSSKTPQDLPLKPSDRHLNKLPDYFMIYSHAVRSIPLCATQAVSIPSIRKYHDDYIP